MKILLLPLLLLLACFSSNSRLLAEAAPTRTLRSQIDLSTSSFEQKAIHSLTEPWEIYWGELLTPQQIQSLGKAASELRPFVAIIPSKAQHFDQPNTFPYGTFRTTLLLPEHADAFALFFPEMGAASRVWMNGEEILKHGVVSARAEDERVRANIATINIPPHVREVELVVQNSSHSLAKIGPFSSIKTGPRLSIDDYRWHAMLRDTFTLSAILIMSFYHFALYFVRGKGIEPLLFGLFCLSMSVITFIRSDGSLVFLFMENPYTPLLYRAEYLAFAVSTGLMSYYAFRLYPRSIPSWQCKGMISGAVLFSLVTVFAPLKAIDFWVVAFQVLTLLGGVSYIGCLIRASFQKADGALLFLLGFACIIGGALNDILKTNGLIETTSVSHMTLFCFILFQSIILSKRFSQAFTRLEAAEGEIRILNTDLEKKVQQRTATIRMILDHVKSGFLLIDKNLLIQNGFTRSCEDILHQTIHEGQHFSQLFLLNDRQKGDLEISLAQVFDDILPDSVTLSMIKSRLPTREGQVMIQSAVIRDEHQHILSILITVTDATHLAQMEREAKLSQCLVKIMQAQINFKSLLNETFQELERAKDLIQEPQQRSVKMILHTIKGNIGTFGMDDIALTIHHLEDLSRIEAQDLESLIQDFYQFLETYKDILKIDPNSLNEKSYRLHDHHLTLLSDRLKTKGASNEVLNTYTDWMEEIKQVSFEELIGPIGKKARRIGESLGKKVNLVIEGGQISIDADRLQSLVHSLIHLVRNSIDHGLEFPEERGDKAEIGQIFIRVWRDSSTFHVEAGDDGRGIDPELIKQVAVNKGLIRPQEATALNDQEALALIFRSGFSTRDEVTTLSGRGVGMSAIETAVLELGGRISIQTHLGTGTCFHIAIPEMQVPIDLRKKA